MKNKIEKIILRKFAIPILVVVLIAINKDVNFWQILLLFGLAFFINWIFDITIVEWSIKKGNKD
ncbi:hypothetical protein [Flavobacterium sp. CS20]|uniref:hypothetical protein n=1 Tax=Flavobacterium sp. CS20 TaxID=2775246 RepID=UPI001B3A03CD|nr:hypothetical protein [Flavobacterium sp. CS20]QTY27754.1 hypothetical protein IGB25_04300 [Flavobacterium sp. CS20]